MGQVNKKRKPDEIEILWESVMRRLTEISGKRPKEINAVLFLIGVRELGHGVRSYTKEEKQDLMHVAICRLLSQEGYYVFEGMDEDGWPHWKLVKKLPYHNMAEQVGLLKMLVINYFEQEDLF